MELGESAKAAAVSEADREEECEGAMKVVLGWRNLSVCLSPSLSLPPSLFFFSPSLLFTFNSRPLHLPSFTPLGDLFLGGWVLFGVWV